MHPERIQRVSSDTAGIPQYIHLVHKVYEDVLPHISGMELLALGDKELLNRRFMIAEELGFLDNSLHGRTGSNGSSLTDAFLVRRADGAMLDSPTLLTGFGEKHEILFHAPEAAKAQNRDVIRRLFREGKITFIWIENDHIQMNGVADAISLVLELQEEGIPSGLMLDLCHAIGAEPLQNGRFGNEWDKLMRYLADTLGPMRGPGGQPIWQGVHFPVGTLKRDSLPVRENGAMPDSMLLAFADILNNSPVRVVVIENQHGLRDKVTLPPWTVRSHQKANGVIFERLDKTGILQRKA